LRNSSPFSGNAQSVREEGNCSSCKTTLFTPLVFCSLEKEQGRAGGGIALPDSE
jgi:hypothetical protein